MTTVLNLPGKSNTKKNVKYVHNSNIYKPPFPSKILCLHHEPPPAETMSKRKTTTAMVKREIGKMFAKRSKPFAPRPVKRYGQVSEIKYVISPANVFSWASSTAWVMYQPQPAEGTGPDQHLTNKLFWKSVEIRMLLSGDEFLRVALIYDKESGTMPSAATIWNSNSFIGIREPNDQDRFVTIFDHIYEHKYSDTSFPPFSIHEYIDVEGFAKRNPRLFDPQGAMCKFTTAGAQTSGALYLCMVSNRSLTATATGYIRTNFKEPK